MVLLFYKEYFIAYYILDNTEIFVHKIKTLFWLFHKLLIISFSLFHHEYFNTWLYTCILTNSNVKLLRRDE